MSRTIHGTLQPDKVVFSDLPECISYHTELISSGEHAGQIALTIINADNPDCEDTYYGELNSATMEFEVVIPDTDIFIAGNPTLAANVWKFDISNENTPTWLVNHFYDPSFYVLGTESKTTLEFNSGGTKVIEVGMTIYGATSGASAEVQSISIISGTWAGGDAAGTLTLINQSGEFVAEDLRLSLHEIALIHRLPNYETIYWVTSLIGSSLETGNTVLITKTINFNGKHIATWVDTETFQIDVPPPRYDDEYSGSCAIYLAAINGNSSLVEVSEIYHCILEHTSTADDRPTTGANWRTYWTLHDCVWKCNLYSWMCRGVAIDSEGNVYVVGDRVNNKTVWKFNSEGGLAWSYDTGECVEIPEWSGAFGVAVDAADNVYVVGLAATTESPTVWKFDKCGTLLWTYNTAEKFYEAFCVAVDDVNGVVYVGGRQYGGKNIWKLRSIDTPPYVELVDSWNTGEGDPACVHSIAVDAAGNVYAAGDRVTDSQNHLRTVWKLNSSGGIIWSFDTGAFTEAAALGIAVDSVGNVYVGGVWAEGILGTFKLDSSGNNPWSVETGGRCVAVDSDDIPYTANLGAWKLDSSNGDIIWTYPFSGGATIYSIAVTNLWKPSTGHNDPGNLWTNPMAVYDGSLLSSAISSCEGTWGGFLELLASPAMYDKIRFYAVFESAASPIVDIDVYHDGGWHDIYEGVFNQSEWVEKSIPVGVFVSKARIRFSSSNSATVKLNEFDLRVSNVHVVGRGPESSQGITAQKISFCCNSLWNYKTIGTGRGISLDKDGNIFIANASGGDESFVKLDRCGNLVWDTIIPYTLMNDAYGVTVDADGNAYFATVADGAEDANVWKIDTLGNKLWTYSIGAAGSFVLGIAVDEAKCWIVDTAYTTTRYVIGDDKKTYHCKSGHTSTANDRPVTGENWETYWELAGVNVYVTGTRVNNKSVRKLNNSGGLIWAADTGASANAVAVDKDGNVFVAGLRVNGKSVWKFNSSGTEIGSYDTGNDTYGIAVDDDGNVFVTGVRIYDGGWKSVWKLDNSLNPIWTYDTGVGAAFCVATDADGNVYVGAEGQSYVLPGGFPSVFILDSSGILIWSYDAKETIAGIVINEL